MQFFGEWFYSIKLAAMFFINVILYEYYLGFILINDTLFVKIKNVSLRRIISKETYLVKNAFFNDFNWLFIEKYFSIKYKKESQVTY